MEKIKLLIDNKPYISKPIGNETACIKTRLANAEALKEYTINQIVECIRGGYTFIPAVLENGTKSENWKQQQLIGIDIDNETEEEIITPEEAINLLKDKGIKVLAYYYTFSSTENKPKFRLLLLLKESSSNAEEVKFIIETLISLLPQADKCCKDLSRLFYGTNKEVIIVDPEARITLDDVIKIAPPKIENEDKTENIPETKTNVKRSGNLEQLIKEFNLEKYMIQDGNEVRSSSSSWTYFENCKICGHKDCLRYRRDKNIFYCFGANGCKGGTIINYLMLTKTLTYKEAVKYFKYEILKLTPMIELKNYHVEEVQKQLANIGLNIDIENGKWLYYQEQEPKESKKKKEANKEEEENGTENCN